MSSKIIKTVKIKIGAKFFKLIQTISDEKKKLKIDAKRRAFAFDGADFKPKIIGLADGVHNVQTDTKAAFIAVGAFIAFGDVV